MPEFANSHFLGPLDFVVSHTVEIPRVRVFVQFAPNDGLSSCLYPLGKHLYSRAVLHIKVQKVHR